MQPQLSPAIGIAQQIRNIRSSAIFLGQLQGCPPAALRVSTRERVRDAPGDNFLPLIPTNLIPSVLIASFKKLTFVSVLPRQASSESFFPPTPAFLEKIK